MRRKSIWILCVLVLIAGTLAPFLKPTPPKLWVLSVGQGEAVLYRDSTGALLLYDGGPDDTVLSELGRVLPPWRRTINIVALSHKHADHIRGLIAVLTRYNVSEVWESGVMAKGNDVARFNELIATKSIKKHHPVAGQELAIGNTRTFVLHPLTSKIGAEVKDQHDATVILKLFPNPHSVLLTGDIDEGHEKLLMEWCLEPLCSLQSTILQVPHHGSASGLSPPFLQEVAPRFAFISVGKNNRYRHPRPEILEKLQNAKVQYHRTDEQGGLLVTFLSDSLSLERYGSAPR